MTDRIELPGGYALVRCTDETSPHHEEWFLEEPGKVWVAKFWDGPSAGAEDAGAFASAIYAALEEAALTGKAPPRPDTIKEV